MCDSKKSSKLAEFIGNRFCETAVWPNYVELDIEFLDSGGIEALLSRVDINTIDVFGRDNNAEVRFATIDSYKEYAPCGDRDLKHFVKASGLFGKKVKENQGLKGIDDIRIQASEIADELEIEGTELARLVKLIDLFGKNLHSGGRRGDDFLEWDFNARPKSIYFEKITSFDEYKGQEQLIEKNRQQKIEREQERQNKFYKNRSRLKLNNSKLDTSFPTNLESLNVSLHPAIIATSGELLDNGHCAEAVQRAAQRFEAFLQDIVGNHQTYGLPLLGKVLGGEEPEILLNLGETKRDDSEQLGFHMLARGIFSALRNFHSHGHPEELSRNEAIEYLCIISAVWKRLELASK